MKMKSEKRVNATWFSFFFIVSHSGVGFRKVLVLGLFFASHSACRLLEGFGCGDECAKKMDVLESSGCENQLTKNS